MKVEERTRVEKVFISNDGKEFSNENSCLHWEKVQKLQKVYVVVSRVPRSLSVFTNEQDAISFGRRKLQDFYVSEEYIDLYVGEE